MGSAGLPQEEPMSRVYDINIQRVSSQNRVYRVAAETFEEAIDKAHALARNDEWNAQESNYRTLGSYEVPGEEQHADHAR